MLQRRPSNDGESLWLESVLEIGLVSLLLSIIVLFLAPLGRGLSVVDVLPDLLD